MDRQGFEANTFSPGTYQRQPVITAQIFKAASKMQHIDELFLWIAQTMVQSFQIQVAEIWVVQSSLRGKLSVSLRTLAREDTTLPHYIVANEHIAAVAGKLLSNRAGFTLCTGGEVFSSHQATLLRRYGLNYCTGHFVSSPLLLPVAHTSSLSDETIPTPLMATTLLFLRQPVAVNIQAALKQMTEQAIIVAESQRLLLPTTTSDQSPAVIPTALSQQTDTPLTKLIPHRSENAQLLRSSNPLSGSLVISDKAERRLYSAVDGHKNVEELSRSTGMEMKEVLLALQRLWQEQRIQLYDTAGQSVDSAQFFTGR